MKKIIDLLFKPKDDDRSILPKEEFAINSPISDTDNSKKDVSERIRFIKEGSYLICKGHPEISEIIEGIAIGEDMALFAGMGRAQFLVNTKSKICRKIVDMTGNLFGFDESDFDWNSIKKMEAQDALEKKALYGIVPYKSCSDGICVLSWRIKKDENKGNELDMLLYKDDILLYGIFDSHCNLILPWQPITDVNLFLKNLI